MHCCLNGKAKKKKFRGGFAECNDHFTRQRKLKKNKKHAFRVQWSLHSAKKIKKTPFAECRCCGIRQRGLKKQISLPSAGAMALDKEF